MFNGFASLTDAATAFWDPWLRRRRGDSALPDRGLKMPKYWIVNGFTILTDAATALCRFDASRLRFRRIRKVVGMEWRHLTPRSGPKITKTLENKSQQPF